MLIRTTPGRVTLGNRIRFAVLTAVGVVLGHDAVYAVGHGVGDGYRTAMSALGHDAYWVPLTLAAAIGALLVLASVSLTLISLRQRVSTTDPASTDPRPTISYRSTVWRIWPRLFLVVLAAFMVQENIEQLRTFGGAAGIDVLLAPTPLAVPVLALVTLALAATGALLRWRIEHYRARLTREAAPAPGALDDISPAPEWRLVHTAAIAWLFDRRDAGRAPPRVLLTH